MEQRKIFCRECGRKKKCSHSKIFCVATRTETLFELWRLCKNWSTFITTKVLMCSSFDGLYLIWPTFDCTILPVQSFIHSQEATKTCFQNFAILTLEVRQECLHLKLLLTRLTSSSRLRFANRLLEWMLAKLTLTQCVNLCLQNFTQDIKLMRICKDSSLVRTNLEVSENWSCITFTE